jgi:hypothetical protein
VGIRLTEAEAWEALTAANIGILSTLRADGWPIGLPVWFVVIERELFVRVWV